MSKRFDHKTFNPEAFGAYVDMVPKTRRNELIRSQALQPNTEIRRALSSQTGSYFAALPMFGRIGGVPQNYDGQTDRKAQRTSTYDRGVIVAGRMQSWREMDFSEDITAGVSFMDNVARQVSSYWETIDQNTLMYILDGIFSMTGTDNEKFINAHTYDISSRTGTNVQGYPNNAVSAESLNNAVQRASGDNKSIFGLVILHSAVATHLENQGLLTYFKYNDANGMERELSMGTWNGRTVLIDDSMPTADIGGGNMLYTSYVLGNGAFDYEDVGAVTPYYMNFDPFEGGGVTFLHTTQRKVFAPYGISFTNAEKASLSPTDAELRLGRNWTLVNDSEGSVIDHKAIPIARIISRG